MSVSGARYENAIMPYCFQKPGFIRMLIRLIAAICLCAALLPGTPAAAQDTQNPHPPEPYKSHPYDKAEQDLQTAQMNKAAELARQAGETGGPAAMRNAYFTAVLDAFINAYDLVGAVLLVDGPDGRILVSAGLADEGTGTPMQTDNSFHVMSVTKMFTATAIMMMVEEGKLSLDDYAADILTTTFEGRLANFEDVKIIHLLEHSSGIPDYLSLGFTRAMYENPQKRYTPMEAIEFAYDHPPLFPPGEKYTYTNTGWLLLGEIIKEIDGMSLQESFEKRFFKPLGMKDTHFRRYPEPNLANAYMDLNFDGKTEQLMTQQWGELADGSLVATAEDLNTFLNALLVDKSIVSDDSLQVMMENSHDITKTEYGRGLMVIDADTDPKIGHMARYIGHGAFAMRYVSRDTNIVFLTNSIDRLKDFREIERQALPFLFGSMKQQPAFLPLGKAGDGPIKPEDWTRHDNVVE